MKIPLVKKADERPAAKGSGVCFYCHQKIGQPHDKECVIFTKEVTVRMIIEYPVKVPNFWDKHDIEFHRNESSWCGDNAIDELNELPDDYVCTHSKFELVE